MKKIKRTLAVCGIFAAIGLGSCISFTEDLNLDKKVSLDMQVGKNLTIPLGKLDTIFVDSLLKIKEGSVLDTLDDGYYGIRMSDTIKNVKVNIDSVVIDLDDIDLDEMKTHFDNPAPDDVTIPEKISNTTIDIQSIDLDGVNDNLPTLSDTAKTDNIVIPGFGVATLLPVPDFPVNITEHTVPVSFSYDLPEDVSKLERIWFGTTKGAGQKITLNVDMSGLFNIIDAPDICISDMNITFPGNFTLAADPQLSAYIASGVSVHDNIMNINMGTTKVTGLSKTNPVLPLSVYIVDADFSNCIGNISFSDFLLYHISMTVGGEASLIEDKDFKVSVIFNTKLQMADLEVTTNDKQIDIPTKTISAECLVTGLDQISSVDRIDFKPDSSFLDIAISSLDIAPFSLSDDKTITITFPSEFEFENSCKTKDDLSVGYWAGNKLEIQLGKALGKTIRLRPTSIDASQYPIDAQKQMKVPCSVDYYGTGMVVAKSGVSLSDIEALCGEKDFSITVNGSFCIATALVTTDTITTDISSSSDMSINEKVDKALVALKRIDIDPADIDIRLHFNGVPATINALTMSDIRVKFPSFVYVEYSGNDSRVKVSADSHSLLLNGDITGPELAANGIGFVIDGLHITRLEFDDYVATADGNLVIENEKVDITGMILLADGVISSSEQEDIVVTPTIHIAPLKVNSVLGKVNPTIDPIHEDVKVSLGKDLEFLKNGNNHLELSDPRIILNLDSKVTVPIVLDLTLSSFDENNAPIAQNIKPDKLIIVPACDSLRDTRHTTLILTKNEVTPEKVGDTIYVRISNLGDLMERIPNNIVFDMIASADQNASHYVDLKREMTVKGRYDVLIPLSFDNVHIEYTDTIKNLGKELKDVADKMVGDAVLDILAQVESTIPLGVKIKGKAYDADGHTIQNIQIDSCMVAPGNANGLTSDMKLTMTVHEGALKKLESILLTAYCDAVDGGTTDASLKKGQYLLIGNLKLKIPNGLNIDFTEDDKK